jgi:hypothetical protein
VFSGTTTEKVSPSKQQTVHETLRGEEETQPISVAKAARFEESTAFFFYLSRKKSGKIELINQQCDGDGAAQNYCNYWRRFREGESGGPVSVSGPELARFWGVWDSGQNSAVLG